MKLKATPIEDAIDKRGVTALLHNFGWAPGLYTGKCVHCDEEMTAAKLSCSCLPCALKLAVDQGEAARASAFRSGEKAARRELSREICKMLSA